MIRVMYLNAPPSNTNKGWLLDPDTCTCKSYLHAFPLCGNICLLLGTCPDAPPPQHGGGERKAWQFLGVESTFHGIQESGPSIQSILKQGKVAWSVGSNPLSVSGGALSNLILKGIL